MNVEEFATAIWEQEQKRRRTDMDNFVFCDSDRVDVVAVVDEILLSLKKIMHYDLEYVFSSLHNICYVGLIGPNMIQRVESLPFLEESSSNDRSLAEKCHGYHYQQLQKLSGYSRLFREDAQKCVRFENQMKEIYPEFGMFLENKLSSEKFLCYQRALQECYHGLLIACEGDSYVSASNYAEFIDAYQRKIQSIHQNISEKIDKIVLKQAILIQKQFYISEIKEYLSLSLKDNKVEDLAETSVSIR